LHFGFSYEFYSLWRKLLDLLVKVLGEEMSVLIVFYEFFFSLAEVTEIVYEGAGGGEE
jgi:hypothetical protein